MVAVKTEKRETAQHAAKEAKLYHAPGYVCTSASCSCGQWRLNRIRGATRREAARELSRLARAARDGRPVKQKSSIDTEEQVAYPPRDKWPERVLDMHAAKYVELLALRAEQEAALDAIAEEQAATLDVIAKGPYQEQEWEYQKLAIGRHPKGRRVRGASMLQRNLLREPRARKQDAKDVADSAARAKERTAKRKREATFKATADQLEDATARQQEALRLHEVELLSYAEIGERLVPPCSKTGAAKLVAKALANRPSGKLKRK